jgi:hypothetical protein
MSKTTFPPQGHDPGLQPFRIRVPTSYSKALCATPSKGASMRSQAWPVLFPILSLLLLLAPPVRAADQVPALKWEKRSDWISVKTDVQPAAKGDGVADDTAAIQAALDKVATGSVIFLPAGNYRITKSLKLQPQARVTGVSILGQGRDTVITWDGEPNQYMWLDDGVTASRYVGFCFDGKGKASSGIYHKNAASRFETEVGNRHMAFRNFTGTALLTDTQPATAEIMIENCLFEHCKGGIAFLAFNDYDYTIDGCEFRDCATGIETKHGNTYVRNCHFDHSKTADLVLVPEHGSSVRRCTSVGSGSFILYANPIAPVTVQDCIIDSWTNPKGAIVMDGASDFPTCAGGPLTVFDTTFSHGPANSPPINLLRKDQRVLLSSNTPSELGALVKSVDPTPAAYVIPDGKLKGSLTSPTQSFLSDTASIPTTVFDVKKDFGAKGDGSGDDTAAIQKAIDAAREKGHGAIAYLPSGHYIVTSALQLTGSDYFVGGTGFNASLVWRGPEGGTIVQVTDPDHITLEQIAIGNHDSGQMNDAIDVLQTSTGKPSFVTYDNLNVFGMYQRKPFVRGLWLKGLSKDSVVRIPRLEGNIHMVDAAQATILVGNSYEGAVVVEGKDKNRSGTIGLLTHLSTSTPHALYVKDNQSLIATDFYIEQVDNGFSFEGSNDDPPGRITIQAPKLQMGQQKPEVGNVAVEIKNYSGQIFLGHEQFYSEPLETKIIQTGDRPVDFFLWATSFYDPHPVVTKTAAANVYFIGNVGISHASTPYAIPDNAPGDTLKKLSIALDDLRNVGALDLRLNHPK